MKGRKLGAMADCVNYDLVDPSLKPLPGNGVIKDPSTEQRDLYQHQINQGLRCPSKTIRGRGGGALSTGTGVQPQSRATRGLHNDKPRFQNVPGSPRIQHVRMKRYGWYPNVLPEGIRFPTTHEADTFRRVAISGSPGCCTNAETM